MRSSLGIISLARNESDRMVLKQNSQIKASQMSAELVRPSPAPDFRESARSELNRGSTHHSFAMEAAEAKHPQIPKIPSTPN